MFRKDKSIETESNFVVAEGLRWIYGITANRLKEFFLVGVEIFCN